jgi:hypothetical protein
MPANGAGVEPDDGVVVGWLGNFGDIEWVSPKRLWFCPFDYFECGGVCVVGFSDLVICEGLVPHDEFLAENSLYGVARPHA